MPHRGLVDVFVGAVGDIETPRAVRERRDAQLRIPARLQHARAELEARACALDGLGATRQRQGGGMLRARAGGRLLTRAPMRAAAPSIVVVRRATSSARSSSGLKRRSTENQAVPGTTLKFAPLPEAPPTTSIEPRASSLSSG